MVFVSEVLNNNASVVSAIITKTMTTVSYLVPEVKFVHFWTDSLSSQYRNRSNITLNAYMVVKQAGTTLKVGMEKVHVMAWEVLPKETQIRL